MRGLDWAVFVWGERGERESEGEWKGFELAGGGGGRGGGRPGGRGLFGGQSRAREERV